MVETDAVQLIHHALDEEVQFFDTAAGYGLGHSEELLGKGIRSAIQGHSAVICTKIALQPGELNAKAIGEDFKQRVEESLRRLQRERIDVLLIHSPPDNLDWGGFDTQALDELVHDGKVGTYGISAVSLAGVRNVLDAGFGTCVEWVFHLLERRPVDLVFPRLTELGVNYIARSPLSRGLISERYKKDEPSFRTSEFRSTLSSDWVSWTVDNMRKVDLPDNDIARSAIRYCLSHEAMSVVIPGIRTGEQLADLIQARNRGALSSMQLQQLLQGTPTHYPAWA
jgi:aryl-alcohol dehydrogenase-like predicted oxidoreductase